MIKIDYTPQSESWLAPAEGQRFASLDALRAWLAGREFTATPRAFDQLEELGAPGAASNCQ